VQAMVTTFREVGVGSMAPNPVASGRVLAKITTERGG
jgi:hypothetical protein